MHRLCLLVGLPSLLLLLLLRLLWWGPPRQSRLLAGCAMMLHILMRAWARLIGILTH